MEGVPEHLGTDESQKPEGDPMVHRRDVRGEHAAHGPSDKGHEGLETPEEQGDDHGLAPLDAPHAKAFAHGHGEGVHGQPHAGQNQFDDTHGSSFRE